MSIALLSGKIFTGIPQCPMTEALFIRDNSIIATGTNRDIEQLCTDDTERIELAGKFVAPGFVDAHTHVLSFGATLSMVDLRGLTSLKACQEAIARAVDHAGPGEWILGRNWNQNIWEEGRDPNRHDLDLVTPNNPAVMIRICGHANWCNSKAFELAGITSNTPQPAGGHIDREPNSTVPAGVIREARELVENKVPPFSRDLKKAAFLKCQDVFLKYGITCVHSFETLADYQVIHEIQQEGKLKIRVYHTLPVEELTPFDQWDSAARSQSEMLWHGHTKLFADGSLGAKTAFLHNPYTGSDDDHGIACLSAEQMQADIEFSYRHGRSVIIHAIGDRAVTEALDAIEKARKNLPGSRHDRIEHIQLCRPEDLVRMKSMDIAASVQPVAIQTDRDVADKCWGESRCKDAYAWKSMEKAGLRLMFSSDAPIESIDPLEGMQSAITRRDFKNYSREGWHLEQCLSVESALKYYFTHAGRLSGKEDRFGTIQPGRLADLTILTQSPFDLPMDKLRDIKVHMTIVDGKIVFEKGDGVHSPRQ